MSEQASDAEQPTIKRLFVDEAGDMTLFNKRKRPVRLGENGVSKFFMVGFAEIPNIAVVEKELEDLRADLILDPTLKNVPSMKGSALFFHCKDDCVPVRRAVFDVINRHKIRLNVIIRHKEYLREEARRLFQTTGTKLNETTIYKSLVSRIFKNNLHKANENHIVVASRGKSNGNAAMIEAIERAKTNFYNSCGIEGHNNHRIVCTQPQNSIGLQVVDYYLWALQRLYERQEDYYFNKCADRYSLIMDIDDKTKRPYGEWYSKRSNPLQLSTIHWFK